MSKASIADRLTKEILDGFDELPSIHQSVGTLGNRLRRCKPGTKLYNITWDRMTKLDNRACEIRSRIRGKLTALLVQLELLELLRLRSEYTLR